MEGLRLFPSQNGLVWWDAQSNRPRLALGSYPQATPARPARLELFEEVLRCHPAFVQWRIECLNLASRLPLLGARKPSALFVCKVPGTNPWSSCAPRPGAIGDLTEIDGCNAKRPGHHSRQWKRKTSRGRQTLQWLGGQAHSVSRARQGSEEATRRKHRRSTGRRGRGQKEDVSVLWRLPLSLPQSWRRRLRRAGNAPSEPCFELGASHASTPHCLAALVSTPRSSGQSATAEWQLWAITRSGPQVTRVDRPGDAEPRCQGVKKTCCNQERKEGRGKQIT